MGGWSPGAVRRLVARTDPPGRGDRSRHDDGSLRDVDPARRRHADRPLDGDDLRPVLFGTGPGPRDVVFYYRQRDLYAVREGPWKAHFISQGAYGQFGDRVVHESPELYNLDHDPSEQYEVSATHPDVIARQQKVAADHKATVQPYPSRLEARIGDAAP